MAQTAPVYVHLTVNLTLVNTWTDRVVVLQVGWVITVQQNVSFPLERIVSIHAINTVSTRRVTESTAVVCMAVNMGTNVTKIV